MKPARFLLPWLLAAIMLPARALPLDFERTGLAWSPAEVSAASDGAVAQVMTQARTQHVLGCAHLCARIDRVWRTLLAVLGPDQARRLHLNVVRLEDEEAFAVPGGDVVLSERFVERRHLDDAELGFVLAHELAHVLLQHERQTLTAALSLLPRTAPRTVDDMYVELQFNIGLQKTLEPVYQQAEREADEVGLQIAALAGFAPTAQLEFLRDNAAEAPRPMLVDTHGSATARLDAARALLPLALRLYDSASGQRAPLMAGSPIARLNLSRATARRR